MEALKYILNHCLLPVVFKVISQKPVAGIAHSVDGRAGTMSGPRTKSFTTRAVLRSFYNIINKYNIIREMLYSMFPHTMLGSNKLFLNIDSSNKHWLGKWHHH